MSGTDADAPPAGPDEDGTPGSGTSADAAAEREAREAAERAAVADVLAGGSGQPAQASIRRMAEHGVRPRHELGQNFLVDDNILGVIERLADLRADDVALEVGGGLGVLSEHLGARVAGLHVVELDRGLEEPLREALEPFPGAQLHFGDAVKVDYASYDPPPTVCVSNLPYNVAATVILRTVAELPTCDRWVAMVQKEVGERFAAPPGTKAYGAPSALAQLSCDVKVLRAVSRRIFSPVPNVDSVLLGLRRVRPPAPRPVRDLINAAFLHRRKVLAKSVSLGMPRDAQNARRDAIKLALEQVGLPLDVRAERVPALAFADLTRAIAATDGDDATVAAIDTWRSA
ncbi:16S rRNA (adenine(1518)-N(6)/adenine(1519)-N(6))-dimethyltransferase RsmA [Patulibacter sp.]|uniref:16S rRNA (adenine(1518)-N(6)/adenine(1519)-N(6))- dimethyltransferase RsmA n=1 Tax=Patulibacter sp. TaxID=1912859 RepID=UPI00272211F3|nr:16S rRNA (adenine(1518)-N(6)/adenine(1519)-N(6))-dimethyltransferase RsmA [Patulibacter sp.]MDO9409231.1 16S rRNA (adenine(1518)-N(6)/adenine(1519)-N(6))-dimethyltransferase RsmA [Patulibacter sp.]